jgi:hypothetical protein
MRIVEIRIPEPKPGKVRVRDRACGINFIDTYHWNGLYPAPYRASSGQKARASSTRWALASRTSRIWLHERRRRSGRRWHHGEIGPSSARHSPSDSQTPLQQSLAAVQRRPESWSQMQQRPATHAELDWHVALVVQH